MAARCSPRWIRVSLAGLVASCGVVWVLGEARAQDPVHGYVDPCSIATVQESGLVCELCSVPAEAPQVCGARFGERGFEKKCRTRGSAPGWAEIWCRREPSSEHAPETTGTRWLTFAAVLALVLGALALERAWSKKRRAG